MKVSLILYGYQLSEKTDDEEAMLSEALNVLPNSRLACQIRLVQSMDGLVVEVPAQQG